MSVWWELYKPSFCWLVSYLLSIPFQMELHARYLIEYGYYEEFLFSLYILSIDTLFCICFFHLLSSFDYYRPHFPPFSVFFLFLRLVFKQTIPKNDYMKTLLTTYMAYSISILLSSLINYVLVDLSGVHHRVAWFATLLITGLLNYFLVSKAIKGSGQNSSNKQQ